MQVHMGWGKDSQLWREESIAGFDGTNPGSLLLELREASKHLFMGIGIMNNSECPSRAIGILIAIEQIFTSIFDNTPDRKQLLKVPDKK